MTSNRLRKERSKVSSCVGVRLMPDKNFKLLFSIEVPMKIISANVLLNKHWTFRRKYKESANWAVAAGLIGLGMVFNAQHPGFPIKIHLRIISYRKRKIDEDNLIAGAKPLQDALAALLFLPNDSPEHISILPPIQYMANEEKTVLEIYAKKD